MKLEKDPKVFKSKDEVTFESSYSATKYAGLKLISDCKKKISISDFANVPTVCLGFVMLCLNFNPEHAWLREGCLIFAGLGLVFTIYNFARKIIFVAIDWRSATASDEMHVAKLIQDIADYDPRRKVLEAVRGNHDPRENWIQIGWNFLIQFRDSRKNNLKVQAVIPQNKMEFEEPVSFQKSA